MKITETDIAKACHQANKALCEAVGDATQKDWEAADEWQRESAIKGVRFALENPDAPESAQHDAWMKDKLDHGWKYGPVKNPETKEHPCIIPFTGLPLHQQAKDVLFRSVVAALKPLLALLIVLALLTSSALAQTNVGVKGTMSIAFNSRTQPGVVGIRDVYTLNLTVNESVIFAGAITNTPFIDGLVSASQHARIDYGVTCSLINPRNAADIREIGKFSGAVPITPDGLYDYANGNLKISVVQMGRAEGFESRFLGTAQGKALKKKGSFLSKAKEALSVGKSVGGNTVTLTVTNYDTMVFSPTFTMAAGPVGVYPKTQVSGSMIYDYDRGAWYPKDVGVNSDNPGSRSNDKLSGSIRWTEKPKAGNTRHGQYEFDLRVNEPVAKEGAHFTPASTEDSFFQVDDTLMSLAGTMKYVDTFSGSSVVRSEVTVALVGNKISKQQCMELAKLIIFSMIVPMNNE